MAFSGEMMWCEKWVNSAFRFSAPLRCACTCSPTTRMRKALLAASASRATVQGVARSLVFRSLEALAAQVGPPRSWRLRQTVAELLPPTIHATIVLDSDTIVVADTWRCGRRKAEGISAGPATTSLRQTAAAGGACLRGQRLNSGVVVMDLALMRARNWTGRLLERIAALGRPNVPARSCGKMVRNGSLVAGDQELLSYAYLKAPGSCVALPDGMHQDKCEGLSGGRRAIVLHFNCGGDAPGSCPGSGPCARVAQEYARLYGVAWRAAG